MPFYLERREGLGNFMGHEDRRIIAAGRGLKAIGELLAHALQSGAIAPQIELARHVRGDDSQIIHAVKLIGMIVGDQHAIQPADPRRQKLLAHVGRGIHQHPGLPARRLVRHQYGAARAPVFRILRIAGAPIGRALGQPGDAPRRTAAQDADFQTHAGRCTLENSRKKLSVVVVANSPSLQPYSTASILAVCTTKAGSLVLPRCGTGARNGASVSTSSFSSGTVLITSRSAPEFLKVAMPETEI